MDRDFQSLRGPLGTRGGSFSRMAVASSLASGTGSRVHRRPCRWTGNVYRLKRQLFPVDGATPLTMLAGSEIDRMAKAPEGNRKRGLRGARGPCLGPPALMTQIRIGGSVGLRKCGVMAIAEPIPTVHSARSSIALTSWNRPVFQPPVRKLRRMANQP